MPRERIVDYPCQFLIFRPRSFDNQSRARCPGAIAHYLDANRKPGPMIIHIKRAFWAYHPLMCGPPFDAAESGVIYVPEPSFMIITHGIIRMRGMTSEFVGQSFLMICDVRCNVRQNEYKTFLPWMVINIFIGR